MTEEKNVSGMKNLYSAGEYFDKWSSNQNQGLEKDEGLLFDNYCNDNNAKILNVGCGSGRETFALYRLGFHNIQGLDCTNALLNLARKYSQREGLNIDFITSTADKIPFDNNTFDIVTVFQNVFGHITPYSLRYQTLLAIYRILKPGGLLFLNANSLYHCRRYYIYIRILEFIRLFHNPYEMEKGDKKMRSAKVEIISPSKKTLARSHWFRPGEIPNDAKKIGFSIIRSTTVVDLLRDPLKDSNKLHHKGLLLYVLKK